jgi:hypothetical protein
MGVVQTAFNSDLTWVSYLKVVVVTTCNNNIIHLQNHAAKLGREE